MRYSLLLVLLLAGCGGAVNPIQLYEAERKCQSSGGLRFVSDTRYESSDVYTVWATCKDNTEITFRVKGN